MWEALHNNPALDDVLTTSRAAVLDEQNTSAFYIWYRALSAWCVPGQDKCFGQLWTEWAQEHSTESHPLAMTDVPRHWLDVNSTQDSSLLHPFKLIQYNVLAHSHVPGDLVDEQKPRVAKLGSELASYAADIYCLQEVDTRDFGENMEEALPQVLGNSYKCRYFRRPSEKHALKNKEVKENSEGVVLAWNTERFRLKEGGARLLDLNELWTSEKYPAILEYGRDAVLDSVALVVTLVDKALPEGKNLIVVGCPYLTFEHGCEKWEKMKKAQVLEVESCVYAEMNKWKSTVGIVAGDFNMLPNCDSYNYLLRQEAQDEEGAQNYRGDQDSPWISAYGNYLTVESEAEAKGGKVNQISHGNARDPTAAKESREPHFTNVSYQAAEGNKPPFRDTLDYVFYNASAPLQVTKLLQLPPEDDTPLGSLPNELWPSDHLALGVEFAYDPDCKVTATDCA
eukprot:TRINITY_DN67218_c7_g1_i1.p1 TRINITY_DN67218_c7_g1~~TRINITY_DN67218_c7_g1_i1.p1  ORF type:complete len:453 (-),score=42.07 TRINITY_DN67218_c7_g1_i1:94-1452(-)